MDVTGSEYARAYQPIPYTNCHVPVSEGVRPPGNRALFSTFRGDFLTKLHRKPGEKGQNIHGRKLKIFSGDGAPTLRISVPCHGLTCPDLKVAGKEPGKSGKFREFPEALGKSDSLPALSGPVLRDTARLSQRYPPIARYGV